jgi:hypothetical protein
MKLILIIILILSLSSVSCNDKEKDKKEIKYNSEDDISSFLFAGMINENPGIYKYNFSASNYKEFWSAENEKVVELSYSENKKNIFFVTAKGFGKSGAFPFINDVKLYVINPESGNAGFVEELGSGLQVFTQWKDENNFRIIINSFDKTKFNFINHRSMLFNIYGKKLEDKTQIYDITKQGYPQLPEKEINLTSPDKKYTVKENKDDSAAVYLYVNGAKEFITSISKELKQVEWKDDKVFISSISIEPDNESLYSDNPETSKLFIYSLKQNKILKMWKGSGVKYFFIIKDKIIFDTGFGDHSKIIIYNYEKQKTVEEIKIDGGCGLKNIPQIPDYSV